MGVYTIGMIAHSGAGKTSLAEAILHRAGAVKRLGSVDAGTSALDYEPDEKDRHDVALLAERFGLKLPLAYGEARR